MMRMIFERLQNMPIRTFYFSFSQISCQHVSPSKFINRISAKPSFYEKCFNMPKFQAASASTHSSKNMTREKRRIKNAKDSVHSKTLAEQEPAPDVKEIVSLVRKKGSKRDVMILSVPSATLENCFEKLIAVGFRRRHFLDLSDHPGLFLNTDHLIHVVDVLQELGMRAEDIPVIVGGVPNVLELSKETIHEKVEKLNKLGFSIKHIHAIIPAYPEILIKDLNMVDNRIAELKELFKSSDTFLLLSRCPKLLFCDMGEIMERFNYVFHEMGISQPQMMHTNLFSYPIEHVHVRHMFAVRAGFFKKVKRRDGQIDTNPKLDTLIDDSDEHFAKTFGNMSVDEYNVFKQLLQKEQTQVKDLEEYDSTK